MCSTFELYLTDEENARLRDPSLNDRALLAVLRTRAKLLGLHFPSEATKGRTAMIVNRVAHGGEYRGAQWLTLLRMLKESFRLLGGTSRGRPSTWPLTPRTRVGLIATS